MYKQPTVKPVFKGTPTGLIASVRIIEESAKYTFVLQKKWEETFGFHWHSCPLNMGSALYRFDCKSLAYIMTIVWLQFHPVPGAVKS